MSNATDLAIVIVRAVLGETRQHGTFPIVTDPEAKHARDLAKWRRARVNSRLNGQPCVVCGASCFRENQTCSKDCGYVYRSRRRAEQ